MKVAKTSAFNDTGHQCPNGHMGRYAKPDYFPGSTSRK